MPAARRRRRGGRGQRPDHRGARASDPDAALDAERRSIIFPRAAGGTSSLRAHAAERRAQALPDANLALISVPGEFAAHEAREALERGPDVLCSPTTCRSRRRSRSSAWRSERGLLLMGPDCGTALIGGMPIAFANAVPRGDIGIVVGFGHRPAGSLDADRAPRRRHLARHRRRRARPRRAGRRARHARRDRRAGADPGTATIVLISKPPAPQVASRVRERLKTRRSRPWSASSAPKASTLRARRGISGRQEARVARSSRRFRAPAGK